MNMSLPTTPTRGVLFIHSSVSALCPHVEWAVAGVLGGTPDLAWVAQPAEPGTYRAELSWQAPAGTSAKLCRHFRFDQAAAGFGFGQSAKGGGRHCGLVKRHRLSLRCICA